MMHQLFHGHVGVSLEISRCYKLITRAVLLKIMNNIDLEGIKNSILCIFLRLSWLKDRKLGTQRSCSKSRDWERAKLVRHCWVWSQLNGSGSQQFIQEWRLPWQPEEELNDLGAWPGLYRLPD